MFYVSSHVWSTLLALTLDLDLFECTDAAAGGADDWAHGVVGVPYVYTVELRDKGRHGFMLPRQQIIPTGEETWDAVKSITEEIRISGRRS